MNLEKAVSHRDHRVHRGKTGRYGDSATQGPNVLQRRASSRAGRFQF